MYKTSKFKHLFCVRELKLRQIIKFDILWTP